MRRQVVDIRRLEQEDLEALGRLLPVWSSREYAKRLAAQERGELVQVVAWEGARPVGRAMVLFPAHAEWSISAHRERCAEVRDVWVDPSHRRRGIARALMDALEVSARAAGAERIGLSVSLDEDAAPARALYSALGYRAAHGPYVSSTTLETDDGPMAVGAAMTYLVRDL